MPRDAQKEWPKLLLRLEAEHGEIGAALQRLYHDENRSTREMYKLLRVGPATLDRLFAVFSIAKRTRSEGVAMQYVRDPERRKVASAVAEKHLAHFVPIPKGATKETCPTVAKIIATRLARYGHAQPYMRREKHGNWRGGSDKKWIKSAAYREARAIALQRDNFKCTECGKTLLEHQWETGLPLSVHHIVPYRAGGAHDVDNLRTLCFSCHGKIERREGIFQYVHVPCGWPHPKAS